MDRREPSDAALRAQLTLLTEDAGATRSAVFAPRDTGLALVTHCDVDQTALDLAQAGWARRREHLRAGRLVRYGRTVLWPLFDGPSLVALVYLDQVNEDFPNAECRGAGEQLRLRLARMQMPSPVGTYLAAGLSFIDAAEAVLRDQLAMALDVLDGNVSAVARRLRVTRETVYARAERFGLDVESFRRQRPRRT
jgi:hypothetical protein